MNMQCECPGYELKPKIFKHLKNASNFNQLKKFCDLLILGQNLIKESKEYPKGSDQMCKLLLKIFAILKQIKDVIDSVTVEALLQNISRTLDWEIKASDKESLVLILKQIDYHMSSTTSLEYLQRLITHIEHVIESNWNSELYFRFFFSYDPVKDISEFKRLVDFASYKDCKEILCMIYEIIQSGTVISSPERKQWQLLLLEAADAIKEFVKWDVSFLHVSVEYVRELKSCIECILAFLANYSEECSILSERDKIYDCKSICDHLIERPYLDDDDGFDDLSDDDESKIFELIDISDDIEDFHYVVNNDNLKISFD